MDEITPRELGKGRNLRIGAVAAPLVLTSVPLAVTFLLMFLAAPTPPVAAVIFFVGLVATAIGFIAGLITAGVLTQRRSAWTRELRERIAARGIRAEEIDWFRRELRPNEKRALKAVEARDLLLADAYRETLASRLTASRIIKSSRTELTLARKRKESVRRLQSASSTKFLAEIDSDLTKISGINDQAKQMLAEAESRLQMIEAAASRQGSLAESELALKKLSARTTDLPLALESAKMSEEIRLELEKEELANDDRGTVRTNELNL